MNDILPHLRARFDRPKFDRLGIALACLCAVHCVVGLVLLAVLGLGLGVGGSLLLHPDIHRVGLVLAMAIAAVAIGAGAVRHRRRAPLVVALAGLFFMGGALAVGHGTPEMVLTVIGVTLLAAGHVLNLRRA